MDAAAADENVASKDVLLLLLVTMVDTFFACLKCCYGW